MRITPKTGLQIKERGFKVMTLGHAYRINGCVDVYYNGRTLYDKNQNSYSNFSSTEKLLENAFLLANKYGVQNDFKKTKTGRMSYQEYKHKKSKTIAEYYHWKNNKTTSEDSLYFIKSSLYIKIGRSKNVEQRIKQLSTGMPEHAELLLEVKNMGHMESTLHKCFSELRTKKRGEWFMDSKRIRDFIKSIK